MGLYLKVCTWSGLFLGCDLMDGFFVGCVAIMMDFMVFYIFWLSICCCRGICF